LRKTDGLERRKEPKTRRGRRLRRMLQKTKNTSLPKRVKDRNTKNMNIIRNLYRFDSVVSSVLPELGPPAAFPPGAALFGPKISSHVKLRVNNAGNSPSPITKPPCEFPNRLLLLPNNPKPPFWLGLGSGSLLYPPGLLGISPACGPLSELFFLGSLLFPFVNIGISLSYEIPLLQTGHIIVSLGYYIHSYIHFQQYKWPH